MRQTQRSNVSRFPVEAVQSPRAPVKGDRDADQFRIVRNTSQAQAAAPAPDYDDFLIDEPDPLLISESPGYTFPHSNGAATPVTLTLIEGDGETKKSRLRIRDLHPMDVAIIVGVVLIGVIV